MIGCHVGRFFQVTVGGGSYQEGLSTVLQGVPPGLQLTEQEIYGDLLLRKPGADELSSPRKEPDIPIIYNGFNVDDTVAGANNKNHTNGTPVTILIPNLDRHLIHIQQYQDTNRTPRPGHASYASFMKYGADDDSIGAGFFSGRYSATIVSAGSVARKILRKMGIEVFSYIKEMAGVGMGEVSTEKSLEYSNAYRQMRWDTDPFYQELFVKKRMTSDMRFLQKAAVLAEVENEIDAIRAKAPRITFEGVKEKYGVHHIINCPDIDASEEMLKVCHKITKDGDSSGGIVEIKVLGVPAGVGEPVFEKLDGELGRMLGIGAVKGVEIGAGFDVRKMTGHQTNDQLYSENGQVKFSSNHAGGITGGLASGQEIIVRLAVKPTPTIDKPQHTIDKYTLKNTDLAAITRRDPTIVGRIWPVAESYTAMVILDQMIAHYGYQHLRSVIES